MLKCLRQAFRAGGWLWRLSSGGDRNCVYWFSLDRLGKGVADLWAGGGSGGGAGAAHSFPSFKMKFRQGFADLA